MELEKRVEELEDLLEQLRVGRRVLMNVLELVQDEQREKIALLEQENEELRRKNRRFANMLKEIKWGK